MNINNIANLNIEKPKSEWENTSLKGINIDNSIMNDCFSGYLYFINN